MIAYFKSVKESLCLWVYRYSKLLINVSVKKCPDHFSYCHTHNRALICTLCLLYSLKPINIVKLAQNTIHTVQKQRTFLKLLVIAHVKEILQKLNSLEILWRLKKQLNAFWGWLNWGWLHWLKDVKFFSLSKFRLLEKFEFWVIIIWTLFLIL